MSEKYMTFPDHYFPVNYRRTHTLPVIHPHGRFLNKDLEPFLRADKSLLGKYVEAKPPQGSESTQWKVPRSIFAKAVMVEMTLRRKNHDPQDQLHFIPHSDGKNLEVYAYGGMGGRAPQRHHAILLDSTTTEMRHFQYALGTVYGFQALWHTLDPYHPENSRFARETRTRGNTAQALAQRYFLTGYLVSAALEKAHSVGYTGHNDTIMYGNLRGEGVTPLKPEDIMTLSQAAVAKAKV